MRWQEDIVRIRNRELSVPIIQGGMGIGVSLGNLAGAVAESGAMGVISSVNAGYREPDFPQNPREANRRALEQEIRKALARANGKGMVAVNIMYALNRYEEAVRTAVGAGAQAIISGAGLPLELPEYVEGIDVAIAPIVSSGKAAKLICKKWDMKYGRVPDFVVIEGPGAGGHLGFKREEVLQKTAQLPGEILPEVLAELAVYEAKYNCRIPVFVGGGIFDGRDMAQMVRMGASGVQIGTRFIATEECDASDVYKQVILNAKAEDIRIIASPVGMPGRALNTPLIQGIRNGMHFGPDRCNDCLRACPHGDLAPYCISRALIAAVSGDVEHGLFFCGENVDRVDRMTTVRELIAQIRDEFLECMSQGTVLQYNVHAVTSCFAVV